MTRACEQGLDRNPANYTPLTPVSFLAKAAGTYPDRVAVIHGGMRRTWAQTYARCRQLASALASLVARNTVLEESRAQVAALLRQALASFASGARPDLVWFKSLYRFARDEGYPLKEQWFPTLPSTDRTTVATLLNQPLATLASLDESNPLSNVVARPAVARLTARIEEYLRGHTEILLD